MFDEPFYACSLNKSGREHPEKEDVIQNQTINKSVALKSFFEEWDKCALLISNMEHYIELMLEHFLMDHTCIFLICNPTPILESYSLVIEKDLHTRFGYSTAIFTVDCGQKAIVYDSGIVG